MSEPNAEAQAPAPGTPEYDAAMAAKFRDTQSATQGDVLDQYVSGTAEPETASEKPTRPDHIPEKFWDAEKGEVRVDDLLKSYTELESKGGKPADKQEPVAADDAQKAVEKAGLNWDELGSKITAKGDLEASDYEALEKAGIPKDLAQNYVKLLGDAQARATADAMSYIGGSQDADANAKATAELLDWAAKNLTDEEKAGYNSMLAGPQWKVAVDTLKTRRGQAGGTGEPVLVTPKTAPGSGTTVGYKTEDEQRADMRNPLYYEHSPKGEAFRQQVYEKTRLAAYRRR